MKYRLKLVSEYETLKEKYKITRDICKSKYKDMQDVINKILRLTKHLNNLKNYTTINARLHYLINGFAKCPECKGHVLNYKAECCSIKCANILRLKNECPEKKKIRVTKAAESRDYESATKKRLYTMANTIDEDGNNMHKLASLKSANTMMSTIEENGLSVAQNRSLTAAQTIGSVGYKNISKKAVSTRKENNTNSAFNYWSSMSEEEKNYEANKRSKQGIETKIKNNSNSAKTFWSALTEDQKSIEANNRSNKTIATKIKNGKIRPIEDRDAYEVYCSEGSFKHGFETKSESQKALLTNYGVFNAKYNTTGCVRDHLLSRRYGFDNNVDPEIISHPANCEIVLHSENIRRANTNDNLITLEELLERIESWVE